MSALTDLVKDMTADSVDFMAVAGDAITLASQVGGVISTAIGIVNFFNNLMQPTNADVMKRIGQLESDIQKWVNQIETQITAGDLSNKNNDLDLLIKDAVTAFDSLPDTLTNPKLTEDYIQGQINDCFNAVNSFSDPQIGADKWQIPWADASKYQDKWSGDSLVPAQGLFEFHYTLPLPYFLRAIYIYITVAGALRPSGLTQVDKTQLGLCADRLQQVHDTIVSSGLVGTPLPGQSDVAALETTKNLTAWKSSWFNRTDDGPIDTPAPDPDLWPFGAVEEYSAANTVQTYWPFLPYRFLPGTLADNFFYMLQLRIEDQRKLLYTQIGLPIIRGVIAQLRSLAGQAIPAGKHWEDWSLREAFGILHLAPQGPVFQSLNTFLRATPPYSGGPLYPAGQTLYPPSPLPKSFRALFRP
jgi:hypothetical protein